MLRGKWGGHGHQRKHMTGDDISLALRKLEILLGPGERAGGMREPMQTMRGVRIMPIIEKIVMQQRAANEGGAVNSHARALQHRSDGGASPRDRSYMFVHAHGAVLDKPARQTKPAVALESKRRALDLVQRRPVAALIAC